MKKITLTDEFVKNHKLNIIDKRSVYIEQGVAIGNNVTIYPNNYIVGKTTIGDNVTIKPNCYIDSCTIGNESLIISSYIENAEIGKNVLVGPFARLRNGAVINDNVKIGNFVEVKKSVVGEDSKASHLAYIGDATIGKGCNIGCGAIFVNYDGKDKHRSTVGDNCFIGSNCNVIAPCEIEDDSYICAGTTVTKKVDKGDFVIGRVRQEHKKNYKHKYLKKD